MNIDIFNHMVELNTPELDAVFHALGDATRRQMLRELAQADRTVGELAAPFAISLAAASKHVKALENAGLIRREVRGRTHVCHLNPGPLASANACRKIDKPVARLPVAFVLQEVNNLVENRG